MDIEKFKEQKYIPDNYLNNLKELQKLKKVYENTNLKELYGKIDVERYESLYKTKKNVEQMTSVFTTKEEYFLIKYTDDIKKHQSLIDKRTNYVTSKIWRNDYSEDNICSEEKDIIMRNEKNRIDIEISKVEENIKRDIEGLKVVLTNINKNKNDEEYNKVKDIWFENGKEEQEDESEKEQENEPKKEQENEPKKEQENEPKKEQEDDKLEENNDATEPTEEVNGEDLAKKAGINPEKPKTIKLISRAKEKITNALKNPQGLALLAIGGSMAALAILIANPVFFAAIPAAYTVNKFKGKR